MSAEITGTSGVKVKSGISRDRPSKGKFDCKYLTNKKIESSTKQLPADSKNKSVFKPVKSDENAKTTALSSKITAKTATTPVKRERKIYSLPGQRYDPPEEREPLRIFYESLSQQIPSSEMAEFWSMEHGLLSPERARKAFERKHRKQKQIKMRIPVKSPTLAAASNPESYVKQQQQGSKNGEIKAKKRISYDRYDDCTANPRRIKA